VFTSADATGTGRPGNRFKQALGKYQQLGLFSALSSPHVAELLALCRFDWLVVDTEHSPNDLNDVIGQLKSIALHAVAPVVRAAWNDPVLVKQLLDTGAQSVLFPYVETPEQAARAVSSTRYPPAGMRGLLHHRELPVSAPMMVTSSPQIRRSASLCRLRRRAVLTISRRLQ